jgi:outer membrane lipopolysaccharide assembly protein LptE/RlpB
MTGRRAFLLAFAASTLTACGFELRRAPDLRFDIQLTGFPALRASPPT